MSYMYVCNGNEWVIGLIKGNEGNVRGAFGEMKRDAGVFGEIQSLRAMAMTSSICFLQKQKRVWIMFLAYLWIIFTFEAPGWKVHLRFIHMNSLCRLLHSHFKLGNPSVELRFLSPSVEDFRSMIYKCRKERKLAYAL